MEKHLVKVSLAGKNFRVNIPRKLIMMKCWFDVNYVLVEDGGPDKIIIRRFVDGKSLKG